MNMSKFVNATVVAMSIVVAGCATQKDLEAARAVADRAVQDAANAKAAADAAMASANQGKTAAASAQSTANQALQGAQSSQVCCDATNEKMNRMFEKLIAK